jgi:hypothetical protein
MYATRIPSPTPMGWLPAQQQVQQPTTMGWCAVPAPQQVAPVKSGWVTPPAASPEPVPSAPTCGWIAAPAAANPPVVVNRMRTPPPTAPMIAPVAAPAATPKVSKPAATTHSKTPTTVGWLAAPVSDSIDVKPKAAGWLPDQQQLHPEGVPTTSKPAWGLLGSKWMAVVGGAVVAAAVAVVAGLTGATSA